MAHATKPLNYLKLALETNQFLCTAELVLGRDHDVAEAETFVKEAAAASDGIRVISVTDLPGGNPALPPEAFVSFILEHGLTPIAHLAGKDGNRSSLEARLHALAHLGVENILALTGDAQKEGFGGKPKPVYDLDSVLILWLLEAMRQGIEYSVGPRTVHSTPFDFLGGAVVNPYKVREPDQMMQLYKLLLKISVGAKFIITQLGFDLRKLYELKQFMAREGVGHIPIFANVYVPTAKIAQMMQAGDVAGCVVPDELIRRLKTEKKPQRLERAALLVAAVKDLGFAGAHIGGFGLTHRDFMTLIERAGAIGTEWRQRIDELILPTPNEFYLFPQGQAGLSDGQGGYLTGGDKPHARFVQKLSKFVHQHFIADSSFAGRFLGRRLRDKMTVGANDSWRHGMLCHLLEPSTLYRKATLGCKSCGDCLQDHLDYAGCSMRWCYKELRNGPCGGSRMDGTCEARPDLPCIWNVVYQGALAMGDDPRKFAQTLIPPRDWHLDGTNAMANRMAGLDNFSKRIRLGPAAKREKGGS
ncbi:MAG TPA: methylenetetrahydrofolate reductase C-terminal domain-containing protein [Terriglobia bacterium]|nr:methylenetetrahydrofolate reductase C-terminal domain-containing protein [Terriglobia bacterium]